MPDSTETSVSEPQESPAAVATVPAAKVAPRRTAVARKPAKPAAPAATQSQTKTAPIKTAAARPQPRTKDTPTMTDTTIYTEKLTAAVKDAQEKAKAALEKSQASFGELTTFTKGNVEALVESTKILSTGLQDLGKGYVSESQAALTALTAEFKDLAAIKTPAELVEKHTALIKKQFDAAVAASSKNSEALLKLATEAFQPISNRVSLAIEKIKEAA